MNIINMYKMHGNIKGGSLQPQSTEELKLIFLINFNQILIQTILQILKLYILLFNPYRDSVHLLFFFPYISYILFTFKSFGFRDYFIL